jgi:hypothetical protein
VNCEEIILEMARVEREAIRKINAKIAATHESQAFTDMESDMTDATRKAFAATAVLFLIGTTAASAGSFQCHRTAYSTSCVWNTGPNASPYVTNVPQPTKPEDIERAAAEDAKWTAFCKPTKQADAFGVIRLQYAQDGCAFGRSE